MAGVADGQLRDPEGLTRVDRNGEIFLIVASSLCVLDAKGSGPQHVSDGLVRVRYTPHGDLQTEAMHGFRDWLLRQVPSLARSRPARTGRGRAEHRRPCLGPAYTGRSCSACGGPRSPEASR